MALCTCQAILGGRDPTRIAPLELLPLIVISGSRVTPLLVITLMPSGVEHPLFLESLERDIMSPQSDLTSAQNSLGFPTQHYDKRRTKKLNNQSSLRQKFKSVTVFNKSQKKRNY